MTAAVRKVPDSTNGTPPYDGESWQRNVNTEVKALWQVATTRLTSVAGTDDLTASSDTALVAPIAAYAQPMSFWITPPLPNNGGMTINIDGVGQVYLKDKSAATLPAGAIDGVSQYLICFDGAGFRVHGTSSSGGSGAAANTAPDMVLRDEKTAGTGGGTFTSGSFVQRTLNTSVRNVLPGASLSGNQFTLPPGTFLIEWSAPAFEVNYHQSRLFNATDAIVVETGTSEFTSSGGTYATTRSQGLSVVTITSAKAFEIDHICGTTLATSGLGVSTNLAAKEVYSTVYIWQVGSLPSQVNGVAGGAVTWPVIFSTTTADADPGNGMLRLNNATQNTATQLFLDLLDANLTDVTAVIDSFANVAAQIRLVKYDDPTRWLMFNFSLWITASGYRKLTVACIGQSSASPFANGDRLYLAYTASGGNTVFANPTAKVGPNATNGVALTAMRSDAAPAIDLTASYAWTGLHSFNDGKLTINGLSSGTSTIKAPATGGGVATLFQGNDNIVGRASIDSLSNKTIDASANTITNLATAMFAAGVIDTDATLSGNSDIHLASQKAVKSYVDNNLTGLSWKTAVVVATTANIALSGEQTIDGILTSASRVLVKNQSTGSQNGIYVSASGAWTRSTDMDGAAEFPSATMFVEKGTIGGDTQWTCTNDAVTVGTTAVAFAQVSGAGTYSAGTGLQLIGNQFSIDTTVVTLTGAQALTNKTINGNTFTAGTGTLTIGAGKTATFSNTLTLAGTDGITVTFQGSDTYVGRASTDTFTGVKTFNDGKLVLAGSASGASTLKAPAIAVSYIHTLPAATTILIGTDNTATVTNKTIDTASNTFELNGVAFGTATQATAALNAMVGDSGSGGTKGLVPAPGAGDHAAGKYLDAGGSYTIPGGGGGGSLTDTDRQNILLDSIYQSKLFGGYRRLLNRFADGYAASDGVNAGSSSNYAVDTALKRIVPSVAAGSDVIPTMTGYTTSGVTFTASSEYSGGGKMAWQAGDNTTTTNWLSNSVPNPTLVIDLGNATLIAGYTLTSLNSSDFSSNRYPTAWTVEVSTTGAFTGEQVVVDTRSGQVFTVAQKQTYTFAAAQTYRYFRINISASASGNYTGFSEVELLAGTLNNMTVVTSTQTADSSVGNGRVLVEFDSSAAPTLNTDLTAEVTCDGGTHWTSASLSSVSSHGQGGRSVVETVDQATTGGTSFAARIKTLNNKNIPIYGVSLTVH